MRSKAHWGYDAGFLAACAPELRIAPGDEARRRIVVAEGGAGADGRGAPVLGLASLDGEPPLGRLGLLFVEPAAIGRGVGRLLYRDVLRRAAGLGFRRLLIDSDPHAAGFYRAVGAAEGAAADGVRYEAGGVRDVRDHRQRGRAGEEWEGAVGLVHAWFPGEGAPVGGRARPKWTVPAHRSRPGGKRSFRLCRTPRDPPVWYRYIDALVNCAVRQVV
ncbi:hypothetical protein DRB96_26025 [Streptomyces sp. ICC1]|nr:hypothetical protein DRB96_26025 [Streptomyces sp. ICC1]